MSLSWFHLWEFKNASPPFWHSLHSTREYMPCKNTRWGYVHMVVYQTGNKTLLLLCNALSRRQRGPQGHGACALWPPWEQVPSRKHHNLPGLTFELSSFLLQRRQSWRQCPVDALLKDGRQKHKQSMMWPGSFAKAGVRLLHHCTSGNVCICRPETVA